MPKINPFMPNSPVSPGMFVGRIPEIRRMQSHLIQTRSGNPTNFMLTGERGIGKSSLLNYWGWKAAHSQTDSDPRFLVVDTDLDAGTTRLGLLKKIEMSIRRQLGDSEPVRQFLSKAWSFMQRVETSAFKLSKENGQQPEEAVVEEFAYSLADIVSRTTDSDAPTLFNAKYNGVLILIDEAEKGSLALELGSFFKQLLERLQRRGCKRLMIGLAGLSTLRDVLYASHPSSLRLFDNLSMERLTNAEVNTVIDFALEASQEINDTEVTITDEARRMLIHLSEGYPHFIQQFGFSAFDADVDNEIDIKDVDVGTWGEFGAIQTIGDRYYRDDFYNKIQKDNYRQVLRIMANNLDGWVTKKEIRDEFQGTDSVLTNAIKALRDREIILPREGERGVYRLQHKGFAYWIKLYGSEPRSST